MAKQKKKRVEFDELEVREILGNGFVDFSSWIGMFWIRLCLANYGYQERSYV